ncbi:hypothetical protein HG530_008495 [Fusarium avenaceum]|nr:hypothetical protein HG530_008495 [Fusarium avenaceum]
MRYSYTLLAFAVTALSLPTNKPASDDKLAPGQYERTGPEKSDKRNDDGSWRPDKYEGECNGYDDGKWAPGKYEGKGTSFNDGKW